MEKLVSDGLIQSLCDGFSEWTWTTLAAILISSFIATRIITGFQNRPSQGDSGGPQTVRKVPYWFPWIGNTFSVIWNYLSYIERTRLVHTSLNAMVTNRHIRKYMKEPVFGITLRGVEEDVVTSPSVAESILSSPVSSITPFANHILARVFGDRGQIRNLRPSGRRELDQNALNLLMREPSVTETTPVRKFIERETPNLVTFCHSMVDQVPWERGAQVTVTDEGNCEANLFALVRNFVGHITTSAFMGFALTDAFPGLLDDLWALDDQFVSLSMGASRWVLPGVSSASRARVQLHHALAIFHDAFTAWDDGADPGVKFRDFDDVSEPVKQQVRTFRKLGLSHYASAPGHLSLLWALNAQTATVVFWNVIRVFADRTLLEDIREEIRPFAKASRTSREETGFPFEEPPRLSLDLNGLSSFCPLLKASYYESMRLDSAPLSFRRLTSDLAVTESNDDASNAGLTRPRTYKLKKAGNIAIPHGVFYRDTRCFSNPEQYDPLRFIRMNESGMKEAYMHTIKPSGGLLGYENCMPAEREILAFTAAFVAMWDIGPVDGKELIIPGHKPSSATFLPKNDTRVKLRVRV